jgi:predicted nucleic acid-binding protein
MPESEGIFLDTNVVLYALGIEEPKRTIAQAALDRSPIISVQVLSEAANVLHRKYGVPRAEVVERLEGIEALVDQVTSIDRAIQKRAWDLWCRHPDHWFDCLILASSMAAGCNVLYSEDFQHGQIIDNHDFFCEPAVRESLWGNTQHLRFGLDPFVQIGIESDPALTSLPERRITRY